MKKAVLSCALALAALVYPAAACRAPNPPGQSEDPFASVPRVTVNELAEALKEGRAVALDVRPAEAFEEEHVKGAVGIPEDEVVARAGELPREKLVVAYCA